MKNIYLLLIFYFGAIAASEPKFKHPHFACFISTVEWYLKNGEVTEIPLEEGKEVKKENRYILSPHFADDSFIYITKKGIVQRELLFPSDIGHATLDKGIASLFANMTNNPPLQLDDLVDLQLVRLLEYKQALEQNLKPQYIPFKQYLQEHLTNYAKTYIDAKVNKLIAYHKQTIPCKPSA